jgi:ribose transport system ATP-binding protein
MLDSPGPSSPQEASPPLVELRRISKSYGGVPVLKEAHLTVGAGEIHGLVGENGAGKSTLVKILAGEVPCDGGETIWMGQPASITSRDDAARLGITMIHQELNLAPHLTVAANIFLGQEPTRRGRIDRPAALAHAKA